MPLFADGVGPGEKYTCHGTVEGAFKYRKCNGVNCDAPASNLIDEADGSTESTGPDGIIEFPPDPTEGAGNVVEACCDADLEMEVETDGGEVEGEDACRSDCAHAACLEALERFNALVDPLN